MQCYGFSEWSCLLTKTQKTGALLWKDMLKKKTVCFTADSRYHSMQANKINILLYFDSNKTIFRLRERLVLKEYTKANNLTLQRENAILRCIQKGIVKICLFQPGKRRTFLYNIQLAKKHKNKLSATKKNFLCYYDLLENHIQEKII